MKTRSLRVILPAVVLLLWLVGAGVGGPTFGKIAEVSSNSLSDYLPESAESTAVQEMLPEFLGQESIPAIVVIAGEQPLTPEQLEQLSQLPQALAELPQVLGPTSPPLPSADMMAVQLFIPLDAQGSLAPAVAAINDVLEAYVPAGLQTEVTGPAGFAADLGGAFSGIDGLLLLVAVIAVFVILLLVYRSFLLPVVVLATSMFALTVALLVVWWLAKAGLILLNGQAQGILFILVIGATTDYSLLYLARYRESLRIHPSKHAATRAALRGSIEPILAAGGTVIAGLFCLLLSDLKSNSMLGPVAAIGIIFSILAALTLLPAALYVIGRAAFWPRIPKADPALADQAERMPTRGPWVKVASWIQRHPRKIWITTSLVLLMGAIGASQFQASGVAQSELVLGTSSARDGQNILGEHFPAGSGSPMYVLTVPEQAEQVAAVLAAQAGVVQADRLPAEVQGQVLFQATLNEPADSLAAEQIVLDTRAALASGPSQAQVGGVSAIALDTQTTAAHDRNLIIPLILLVITLILMLLLRSILAPLLLIATTVLSFGTAMGVSALFFNQVLGFPGADPAVPLYGFVFLVALGIDYNIFLMTRIREEALTHGTRIGIERGLVITGGVITSAGLVLAATFAALSVLPILFLVQLSFIVAFGVLLDTFVVRTLLVPALSYDIGPKIWWPSKLGKQEDVLSQ